MAVRTVIAASRGWLVMRGPGMRKPPAVLKMQHILTWEMVSWMDQKKKKKSSICALQICTFTVYIMIRKKKYKVLFIFSFLKNLNLIIFNWRIALQYCIGFWHISTHPTPLGCPRAPNLSSLHHIPNFPWISDFTYGNEYVSMILSVCPTLSFPHCVHKSVLYVYTSIAALQIGSSNLSRFHIHMH